MKSNKKLISLGCATIGVTTIGAIVLATIAINHSDNGNSDITPIENKPDGRTYYEHAIISTYIDKEHIKDKCVDYSTNGELTINETKFRTQVESIIRYAFKQINKFKNNADEYTIEVSYQYNGLKTIATDIVWYIPSNNPYKYYDQLEIKLQ